MDEPLSSQATTIGGGVSTTFHQDDPSSGEYAQAAPSFSTSRKNAVASSSSSRVNAPASSSRSYGPPPSEASSSRLRPNVDQGPSYPSHLLSDLEASIPVDTGFDELHPAALSHLMEELDARHAELRAEVNRLKHNNVEDPKKSAGEGEEHPTTYTEADVPGFVEMLSSEEIELFEHVSRPCSLSVQRLPTSTCDHCLTETNHSHTGRSRAPRNCTPSKKLGAQRRSRLLSIHRLPPSVGRRLPQVRDNRSAPFPR